MKRRKLTRKTLTLALVLLLLFSFPASFAYESNGIENHTPAQNIEQFLKSNDVPPQKIESLLEKHNTGVLWDCQEEGKLKMVPESFYIFDPSQGSETRYFRFEDGSFIKIQAEQLESKEIFGDSKSFEFLQSKGFSAKDSNEIIESAKLATKKSSEIGTKGVDHGTGYVWYYDHKVSYTSVGQYAEMYVDFVINQYAADKINSCKWPTVRGFGQLNGYPITQVDRPVEDTQMGRWALGSTTWVTNYSISTPWGGSTASGTYYLWLGVGNNSYRVGPSLPY